MKNFYLTMALLFFFAMQGQEATTTIYLISDAEMVNDSADPKLSEAENLSTNKWANYLKDKHIQIFYTTPGKSVVYKIMAATVAETDRTPGTTYNTQVATYDSKTFLLKDIAEKHKGNKILVIENSNSLPKTINKFLGKEIYKDIPQNEFSNLYIIIINEDKISHELVKI